MGFFQRMFAGRSLFTRFGRGGCAGRPCGHGHWGGQPDPEKVEKRTSQILDRALDWLKATPEQRPQLQAIRAELVKDGLAMKAQKRETLDALWRLWDADHVEGKEMKSLLDERIELLKGFLYRVGERLVAVHGVLTPEQRKQLTARVRVR